MRIEEIRELLEKYYGDDDRGCYVNGRWFSINEIMKILERGY